MASGRLRLQLLGFLLDLLAVVLHPQDFALDLLRSLFAPLDRHQIGADPLLVTAGIASPVESRAQVARCIVQIR